MTIDLKTLSYTELLNLSSGVKNALEERSKEADKAKKEWLTAEHGGNAYLGRIEEFRKRFEKLVTSKSKSVDLRIKLDVNIDNADFTELLNSRRERTACETFNVMCSGKLLNPKDCGIVAQEVQNQITCVMGYLCGEACGLRSDHKALKEFVTDWNDFVAEFSEEAGSKFALIPNDIVKANKPKGKKK